MVMNATAMPEVVGDTGVLLDSQRADEVAAGVRRALELGPRPVRAPASGSCRDFPLERRRAGLLRVLEEALRARD